MPHGRAPALYNHLDHSIVVFEDEQRCPLAGDVCVWRNMVDAVWSPLVRHERFRLLRFDVVHGISPSWRY